MPATSTHTTETHTPKHRLTINAPLPILRYDPRKDGLQRWFGSTEAMIMEILWGQPGRQLTVQQVHHHLDSHYQHTVAYTTVMTTMTRLWEKGILARHWVVGPRVGAYEYETRESQSQFEDRQMDAIRGSLE